ncbi:hypothetical protein QBC43DRAFT_289953 [Cladorrhinum sp. PSN259]|nr:hypothetical protein QBC43DRAFT_289953 [Cladorrhinum sp. PSN259]
MAYSNNIIDLTPQNTPDPTGWCIGAGNTRGPYEGNIVNITPTNTTNPRGDGYRGNTQGPYEGNIVDLTPTNTTDQRGDRHRINVFVHLSILVLQHWRANSRILQLIEQ